MRRDTIRRSAWCAVLMLVACSRESSHRGSAESGDAERDPAISSQKPAPFDKGPVKVALVQYSGAGDYFQQWTDGLRKQADAVGFQMQLYDAQADDRRQATDMKAAIGSHVAGIIVDHGDSGTLCPLINQATDAGIPVVVYDVKVRECAPNAVETAQNDVDLATLVLTQMAKDVGDEVAVGYVNPFVIAPLERRDVVWKKFVAEHKWNQKFRVGKFSHTVVTDNAHLADRALKAHPDVKAIFAPYDELTKGAVTAIEQNRMAAKVAAYGIDISNTDIDVMTKKESPWKATATTDPSAVGAAVARTIALEMAGKLGRKTVMFPGILVTQSFLSENGIRNMGDLRAKVPGLNLSDISSADWIEPVTTARR
jgi:simple sugar transport system substrate-binding protein